MADKQEMIQYALRILRDLRFSSVISEIANHRCGNDGFHTPEQLFWGVIREKEITDPRTGEKGMSAPIDLRSLRTRLSTSRTPSVY